MRILAYFKVDNRSAAILAYSELLGLSHTCVLNELFQRLLADGRLLGFQGLFEGL